MPPYQIWIWRRRFIPGAPSPLSDRYSRINPRVKESVYATLDSEHNSASVREEYDELQASGDCCGCPCHFGCSWPGGGDPVYRAPSRVLPRPAGAATTIVTVGDGGFFFFPSSVTIDVGDTVQWTWSASGHSSTSGTPGQPSGFWDSGILNHGATFSHTFPAAGIFPYFCTPHGGCCGMIGERDCRGRYPDADPDPTSSHTDPDSARQRHNARHGRDRRLDQH